MRILVTNDDGVDAPGLAALAGALSRAGHEILVVAPADDRSGSSAAIGPLHRLGPVPMVEHRWPDQPDVPVFSLDVPPAVAVYAACLGGFGPVPDLVASGINPGPNTGHLVLHSGTVGAALTAAGLGVSGLAVSLMIGDELHWDTAAAFAAASVPWFTGDGAAPRVLNVNVPNVPLAEVRGVRDAELAPYGTVWTATAGSDGRHLQLEFTGDAPPAEPGTDLALLLDGFVAVTPLAPIGRAPGPDAASSIRRASERFRGSHARP
ncbi:MAG: 5'/3'-nucleotidase SurE [Acidimicrobiia bacterium]|nr:5'/3'-nucleotidase SurE [Acidimicrobiia bacterium]